MIPKKYKSVTRVDKANVKLFGYYVRVAYDGAIYKPRFFSDKKFKSVQRALVNALTYRDLMEKEIGKVRSEDVVRTKITNSTGYLGVREIMEKQTKNGKVYEWPVFEITSPKRKGDKVRRTRVSINKHGREKALELAAKKRREWEIEVFGDDADLHAGKERVARRIASGSNRKSKSRKKVSK
ncbi:MAG: hypothetical protein KJ799_07880 [Bacteroidetes bacterium]|nr:hypothetical protein [Bacteroidota bacterium]MBU1679049.1 hypothetical protein [Bacteroidota bacterium]MBU2506627.1 hypothetical protein [Bacteroidota bacterium]